MEQQELKVGDVIILTKEVKAGFDYYPIDTIGLVVDIYQTVYAADSSADINFGFEDSTIDIVYDIPLYKLKYLCTKREFNIKKLLI